MHCLSCPPTYFKSNVIFSSRQMVLLFRLSHPLKPLCVSHCVKSKT
jgi:hypothetical protein